MTRSDPKHPVEALSAYLDGELPPAEAAELELHLRDCPECGGLLEEMRLLSRAAGEEEPPPLPADLARRIARRLEPAHPEKRVSRPAWLSGFFGAPLAAAAAALLAAGVLWTVWHSRQVVTAPPQETAGREAIDGEKRGERQLSLDGGRKGAMDTAAPADDRAGKLDVSSRQERPSRGTAAEGASTGGGGETSKGRAPAPSLMDEDETGADAPSAPRRIAEAGPRGYATANAAKTGAAMPAAPREAAEAEPPESIVASTAELEATAASGSMTEEVADRLSAPGYVLSERADADADAPEMIGKEREVEVRDGLAYLRPGEGAIPPPEAGATRSSPPGRRKRAQRLAPVTADISAPGDVARDLVLRDPAYEIRLAPSGEMTVVAGEYVCTVSPGEVIPAPGGEMAADGAPAEDHFARLREEGLFAKTAVPPGGDSSITGGPAEGASARQRRLLLELLRGPYREPLERKCGPLPESVAGDREP
jgi:hypothetical protein